MSAGGFCTNIPTNTARSQNSQDQELQRQVRRRIDIRLGMSGRAICPFASLQRAPGLARVRTVSPRFPALATRRVRSPGQSRVLSVRYDRRHKARSTRIWDDRLARCCARRRAAGPLRSAPSTACLPWSTVDLHSLAYQFKENLHPTSNFVAHDSCWLVT